MQGHITQVIFAGGFPPELGTKPGTNPFLMHVSPLPS